MGFQKLFGSLVGIVGILDTCISMIVPYSNDLAQIENLIVGIAIMLIGILAIVMPSPKGV